MTWVLEHTGVAPFTMNDIRAMSWPLARKSIASWRDVFGRRAQAARIGRLDRVDIVVEHLRRDGRSMPDTFACAFAAKAAIDGIVDAGVIDDDSPAHVRSVLFLPPVIAGVDGLRLTLNQAVA